MIAFVAVGYNRPESMKKLLASLADVDCLGDVVDLVISIDCGPQQNEVINVANDYEWHYGNKIIRPYTKKQGLMSHILQCGELTNKYDAVIILEDDLIVSPQCYSYVKHVILRYDNDSRIAGISLYGYKINEYISRPFEPMYNDSDVYMMQVAQSWGQCWTKRMWKDFTSWEGWNKAEFEYDDRIPRNINFWKSTSWKKNFARYIIYQNKYFVYPYMSLTTNCSDAGEHRVGGSNAYQVQLLQVPVKWRLKNFEDCIKYDGFFEPLACPCCINELNKRKICFDFYGLKKNFDGYDYLVSTNIHPYKVIKTIALKFHPHEANMLYAEKGNGIYIYDLNKKDSLHRNTNIDIIGQYDIGALRWRYTFHHGFKNMMIAIKNRLSKLLKKN